MKRFLKISAIAIAIVFAALQFYRPDQTNPPIVENERIEATMAVPENVAALLKRSCYDCHSNATVYPWYSQVSPFSWFLDGHIREGRDEMNFSVWNTYDAKKRARKFEEICDEVTTGQMPLPSYLWIHRDAVLSAEDSKSLCDWTATERAKLPTE